ncbi:MAG TPA: 2-hydroxyacid dehydrogenase [Patescibacteria group bacterium]|nr:2-hydroxyacid dehydrogenase [Patescibacteria group bacterium]
MKIAVFCPKSEFSEENQKRLASLGEVVYTDTRKELKLSDLKALASNADIIAIDPDNFGGFEKAKDVVTKLVETLPKLKGVALSTTSYGWVDLDYFKKRNILVSNVPGYSRESVAEHAIALLLCLAKRIIVTDRKIQKGQYKLERGFELKGKTLGIIGLGNIGSRVAEMALGIGMKVISYNPSPRNQKGVEMKSLDGLFKESDAISLHTRDYEGVKGLINKEAIEKMKNGVVIVNTVDRTLVNEEDMAKAIRDGKVYGYAYEAEDLENIPLAGVEGAVGIRGFGWYTKEALENMFKIWVDNIEAIVNDESQNIVN